MLQGEVGGAIDALARVSVRRRPMCNLYAMTKKDDDLARFLRVSHNRRASFEPVNAIFPRHTAPVVRQSSDGERELVLMSWGFMRLEKGIGRVRFRSIEA